MEFFSGLMADFLRLIDVNAGGVQLKRAREFYALIISKKMHQIQANVLLSIIFILPLAE